MSVLLILSSTTNSWNGHNGNNGRSQSLCLCICTSCWFSQVGCCGAGCGWECWWCSWYSWKCCWGQKDGHSCWQVSMEGFEIEPLLTTVSPSSSPSPLHCCFPLFFPCWLLSDPALQSHPSSVAAIAAGAPTMWGLSLFSLLSRFLVWLVLGLFSVRLLCLFYVRFVCLFVWTLFCLFVWTLSVRRRDQGWWVGCEQSFVDEISAQLSPECQILNKVFQLFGCWVFTSFECWEFTSFGRTDETFSPLWTETLVEVWVELAEGEECSDDDDDDDDDGDDGDGNVEIGEAQMEISPAVLFSFLRVREWSISFGFLNQLGRWMIEEYLQV